MDLVGFEKTQLTDLFLAIRPEGQLYLPSAAAALAKHYRFAAFPTRLEELNADQVSFRHGLFDGSAIENFDVYPDGIIVSAKSSSDFLEAFVRDVCQWMETEIGLKRVDTHQKNKSFESHITVHSKEPLLSTLDALSEIQELIGQSLESATGRKAKFHPTGIGFGIDNTEVAGIKPIPFNVERKAGVPFETNFYYSSAPLPTEQHLKILERLEQLC